MSFFRRLTGAKQRTPVTDVALFSPRFALYSALQWGHLTYYPVAAERRLHFNPML
jgi:hypothetical protein